MTNSHPPEVASWVLEHFHVGPIDESLEGDLFEEYGRRQSNVWYWKQVIGAIGISFVDEIRTRFALAIGAVFTGWGLLYLFEFFAWMLLSRLHINLLFRLQSLVGFSFATQLNWLMIGTPIYLITGWNLRKLQRFSQVSSSLAFAASMLIWNLHRLPWVIHLLLEAAKNYRYIPECGVELMGLLLPTIFILLGGLLACAAKSGISHREAPIVT